MSVDHNWIFLSISESILLIFLYTSIQQLCVADNFKDKARIRRLILIIIDISVFVTLNSLIYLHTIYPHKTIFSSTLNLTTIWIICEAIAAILGIHTFRLLFIYTINTVSNQTSINSPKWYTYFAYIMEIVMIISILFCHITAIIETNTEWVYLYYVILGIQTLVLDIFIIITLRDAIKLLHQIPSPTPEISAGIRKFRGAEVVAYSIIILALLDIILTADYIYGFMHIKYSLNFQMITNILSSVIIVVLSVAFLLWIYIPGYCCKIPKYSVCDVWCCSCLDDDDMEDFQDLLVNKTQKGIGQGSLVDSTFSINDTTLGGTVTSMNESIVNGSTLIGIKETKT